MLVPLNLTGPSYEHRARSQSAQRTVGLFPEVLDTQAGKSKFILNSFPGLKSFATASGGKDRGMFEHKGIVYKVTGTTLSTIDKDGAEQVLGVITGSGKCIFEGIGDSVVIVSDGLVWIYDEANKNINQFIYEEKSYYVASNPADPSGIFIRDNGLTAYILGNDYVYQYDLTIPWDIKTCVFNTSKPTTFFADTGTSVFDFFIGNNGHTMYAIGAFSVIYQYTLSTPWDISTSSYDSVSSSTLGQDTNMFGIFVRKDGKKLYTCGGQNDSIYQYSMTTAWDLSTKSYDSKSLSVTSEETTPTVIEATTDGSRFYLLGSANTIFQYNLGTPWDISTGAYSANSLDLTTEDSSPTDFHLRENNTNIYVIGSTNDTIYQYTSFSQITDTDLETPNSCAHLNNQIIYDGDGGRFVTSDVGDATSIDGLNYATAEAKPDDIKRVYVFKQILYLMGEKTIETWYNSGVGSPPFDRLEGGIIPVGLSAIYSVSNNDRFMYFLGDDNQVYQAAGTNAEHITTNALVQEFQSYSSIEDAIGYCFTFDNQHFYMLLFPAEQKSWCYNEESQQWFEPNEGLYPGFSHVYAFRKNLIADGSNGNIYELDPDTYDQDGTLVERYRDTAPISGELLNASGKRVELNRFELIMETGVGRIAATGDNRDNPYVMLSVSKDGGKTFGTERWKSLGTQGGFKKVEWHNLGSFYDGVIRIKFSDPNYYSIHAANADIEVGI